MRKKRTIHKIVRGICMHNEKIILAYFKKDKYYFLPGGHIEKGESAFEAIKREFMEEMGLKIVPKKTIARFEHSWKKKDENQYENNFIVSVNISGRQKLFPQIPHLKFKWVPVKRINKIKILPKQAIKIIKDQVYEQNN